MICNQILYPAALRLRLCTKLSHTTSIIIRAIMTINILVIISVSTGVLTHVSKGLCAWLSLIMALICPESCGPKKQKKLILNHFIALSAQSLQFRNSPNN
jgi:hypothetical protein